MDISTIKQKIAALEAEIVPNSVSPERVASILSDITSLVENMGYLGYEFFGVATPTASPSFDKDLTAKKYFYIAVQQGTYTNFGGLTVGANDGLTILAYNGTWTKTATGTAMKTDITSLKTSVTNINTKILPLSVSFDLDKIDALTDSSGSTDIKEAFTPLSGIGVAPVAGNILRSGNVIKNSQEVTVIWSDYDSKTAYYSFSYVIDNVLKIFQTDAKTFVRVAKTIVGGDVGAEIEDLQDRVSIGKAPIWITMTLEGEPHDPTRDNIGDIIFFEEGNYLKEVVRSATGSLTLGQVVDMETGRLYVYGGNLCKWEDGDFVPFYLDDINTLKSKARYEYSLSKILALTDTSEESAVEEAFTPTYDPEGSLAPRVPKAGDLLIDGNNTVVVSEGTQIFFSFTYQEEIISMRVYSGGSSFRFNVWKFPAGTVYDFNSIDTLTESSTADDIKKALTPKIGDGMRIPNSGDIMLIGIEENPDTVSVLYRYRNTFAYYHNRLLTTIEVEGEDDSLSVVKTVSKNYVYDFDKINLLTNSSDFSDILHAFTPLIMGSYTLLPKTGDLLTSGGYDEEGNAARSAKVIYHNGNSFAYCYDGKHVTVKLVGELGNPDMRVEKTVTDLAGTGYEPKKYDYNKVMALSNESTELDINEAFTPIGGSEPSTPMPGDLLVSTDDRNHVIILANQQTTASNAAINIRYIYGNILRNISVRFNPRFSISVADIKLDKEVENNGALRITTSNIANITTGGNGSYDLGVTFQQLQEAITNNQLIMGNITGEVYAAEGDSNNVTLMSVAYLQNDWRSVFITIPKYSGTTATVTVTTKLLTKFVQIPYSLLSGEIGGTYDNVKMSDLLAANIIQTDKGIATLDTTSGYVLSLIVDGTLYVRCTIDFSDNGGLKLTARTTTSIVVTQIDNDFSTTQSQVDIGMSFDELKNTSFVMNKNGLLYYKIPADYQNIIYTSLCPYGESTTSFVNFVKIVIITDAGDGKINITPSGYQYKVPVLDSKDKLPAAVMPDSFIAGTGVTAIQTVTELPQSPDSGTLYLIMPSETTTSEEQL